MDAILFDIDGTLLATKQLYLESYRRALAPFVGRELSDAEILQARPLSERRFLAAQLTDAALLDRCHDDFATCYARLHDTLFGGVYAGVAEMLERLRRRGVPLGVVSGKSRRSWEVTALVAALGDFDAVVLDDDVAAPKPDPEGLRLALERMGVRGPALYVGDTTSDADAAAAAGITPGAALWSRTDPVRRAALADHVRGLGGVAFDHPLEVPALLDSR